MLGIFLSKSLYKSFKFMIFYKKLLFVFFVLFDMAIPATITAAIANTYISILPAVVG